LKTYEFSYGSVGSAARLATGSYRGVGLELILTYIRPIQAVAPMEQPPCGQLLLIDPVLHRSASRLLHFSATELENCSRVDFLR